MYLRDVLDDLSRRKLRDVVDFEWKRNIRFYGADNSRAPGESINDSRKTVFDHISKHRVES